MNSFNYIFNQVKLFIKYYVQNKEINFEFFKCKLEQQYSKGALFVYNGIDFYIKDFCSDEYGENRKLNNSEDKIYVVCEYYDLDNKMFLEKIMHQDFVDYRIKQYKKILEENR